MAVNFTGTDAEPGGRAAARERPSGGPVGPTGKEGSMAAEFEHQPGTIAWLQAKLPNLRCPLCGTEGFIIGELLASPVMLNNVINVAQAVPLVPVVCRNCGHVLLFSAVLMGLAPPSEPRLPTNRNEGGNADVNRAQI
jgi:hypothetical protein